VTPAARLLAALRATLGALEAGDVAAATVASEELSAACEGLGQGALTAAELQSAHTLHTRCTAVAGQRQDLVVAELLQSAIQQRASHAYGSTT
jgi:hypothetical protein